jgi:uncharacterized protein (DUF302 family)
MEHIVVASYQPFEKVSDALEARLGAAENWGAMGERLLAESASEEHLGTSGLSLFSRVEHSHLLSLLGKTTRATQYTIGNPLLALQMTRYMPEAALYAPLKLVVYEDEQGNTFLAYDSFVSQLAQYQREEITRMARFVEQKLEALVADVTGEGKA